MTQIAILGAGKIGESLLAGLLSSGLARADSRRDRAARGARRPSCASARHRGDDSRTPRRSRGAGVVVLAVKPQDIETLLGEIGRLLTPEQTVLSVAAAIPTAHDRARTSPPTCRSSARCRTRPSTVHEGIAGICAGRHAGDEHLDARRGRAARTSATSSRCPRRTWTRSPPSRAPGPAYFALLAEAMIEAGILLGLSREVSTKLVVQTMLGTAKLLRDEKMHPVELREAVTSPGGTTIARDPRARAGRRPRGVPERDPGRDGALERARRAATT